VSLQVVTERDTVQTLDRLADVAARGVDRPADARAVLAADRLGLEAGEVERLPFDLSVLNESGIFVNVDARNFGLLDRRLDWRALGITLPPGGDLSFRPPRCGLIPDRYRLPLLRPAGRAHAALHRFSYHFRLIETVFETVQYRWIPWSAWEGFERAFASEQAQLGAAMDAYETDFLAVREHVLDTFRQVAADSARRLTATGQLVPPAFEEAVTSEVLASLPTPEALRQQLTLQYRVGVMQLGSEMWAEARLAADERRRAQELESEAHLAQQRTEAAERLVQEQFWSERERLRRQLQAEEQERQREAAVKERLRELKLEAARERLQEVLSPLEEGARQLHAAVYEAASAIRASLQKHQALRGPSARKLRELCRWYRMMNWQGDDQLEGLVGELEQLAMAPSGRNRKRNPEPIDQVLADIVALTSIDARALAEPNRMAGLEL
jgi:hypothetical protein